MAAPTRVPTRTVDEILAAGKPRKRRATSHANQQRDAANELATYRATRAATKLAKVVAPIAVEVAPPAAPPEKTTRRPWITPEQQLAAGESPARVAAALRRRKYATEVERAEANRKRVRARNRAKRAGEPDLRVATGADRTLARRLANARIHERQLVAMIARLETEIVTTREKLADVRAAIAQLEVES